MLFINHFQVKREDEISRRNYRSESRESQSRRVVVLVHRTRQTLCTWFLEQIEVQPRIKITGNNLASWRVKV